MLLYFILYVWLSPDLPWTKWTIAHHWHVHPFYLPSCEHKWTNVPGVTTRRSTRHWLVALWVLRAPSIRLDFPWREMGKAERRVNISVKMPVRTGISAFLCCWLLRWSFLVGIYVCRHFSMFLAQMFEGPLYYCRGTMLQLMIKMIQLTIICAIWKETWF